jgi:hypothetical protein
MALEKAHINALDGGKKTQLTAYFNPKEYSIQKSVQWEPHKAPGLDLPEQQFTSGNPAVLSVELFFDSYETKEDVKAKYTDKLLEMAAIDVDIHRPPRVSFLWGSQDFQGVIESLSIRFTMFMQNGNPCRAVASVQIKEAKTAKEQTEQTQKQSPDHSKRRTLKNGETLSLIAHEEYDDPAEWRRIADANGIDDPRDVKPGTLLLLPPIL